MAYFDNTYDSFRGMIAQGMKAVRLGSKVCKICNHGPTNTYLLATPIGEMVLVSCPKGIHSLSQVESITDDNFQPDSSTVIHVISQLYQDNGYTYRPALSCIKWLEEYFKTPGQNRELIQPPFCPSITKEDKFMGKVWKILPEKIPFGHTISYCSLAGLCGNQRASRAVGQAMRTNPIQLIIPCHRVVQASGKLGNYSGGSKNRVKLWLLQHENALR
ncbi:hypothetical protein ScPMuIL_004302 [Solemya velum]